MSVIARLSHPADFEGWRIHARSLAGRAVPPADILWQVGDGETDLFVGAAATPPPPPPASATQLSVPRAFVDLAQQVVCHADPERFGLLYRMLLRLQDEPHLIRLAADPDTHRAEAMARAIRRDMHKMTAFVRFREVVDETGRTAFVAWFEPEHFILERVSGFFVKRFASMMWSILTPLGSLHWDGTQLHRGAGASKAAAPDGDAMEAYWLTYYANIFNPARLKIKAMKAEMPVKYWRNLPEAELIVPLIAGAARRAEDMVMTAPTAPPERHLRQAQRAPQASELPTTDADSAIKSWEEAAAASKTCQRCDLYCNATQTVFGEGPGDAPVMFVGEQPGDQEDLAGKPFVGPAGKVFDRSLGEAGLDRRRAYVTNAVKHFKFELRGKRRIHAKPNGGEVKACRFWLGLEREFIKPKLIVALGATALTSLLGKATSISSLRDRDATLNDGTPLLATIHPSYLLRLPDEAAQRQETARFVEDLKRVGALVPSMRIDQAA